MVTDRVRTELVEADPPPRFDLWELLVLGIARSRKLIAFAAVVGVGVAFVVALMTPNTYVSESKLFLRIGRREQISSETMSGMMEPVGDSGPTIRDELHMLDDRAIYEKVAAEIGPSEVLRPADPSRYDNEDTGTAVRVMHSVQSFLYQLGNSKSAGPDTENALQAATQILHKGTVLTTEPESNVITVRYASTAPSRARETNKTIINAFIERHAEQFAIDRYLEENREKLLKAEARRDESGRAYFEVMEECGFFDFAIERPALLAELEDQESTLFTAHTDHAEKVAQHKALLLRIKGIPQFLNTVREREPNPKYMEVRDAIAALEVEISALAARVEAGKGYVAEKEAELIRMRECEKRHAYLAQVRDTQDEHYQALLQRYSLLEDLANIREESTNLSILQQPHYDEEKVGPQRGKMLAIGVLGGLLVGLLIALLREIMDSRLRYPQAIERVLGVRVLDVIPEVEASEDSEIERTAA
jgi:uncharacterized protein involved in exopolysaccharide biosynthesis